MEENEDTDSNILDSNILLNALISPHAPPQGIYQAQAHKVAEPPLEETIPAPDLVKPNAYCLHDGMVCIREENVLRPLTDMPSEMRSRIRHLISVRDAVRDCLRSQMDGSAEDRKAAALMACPGRRQVLGRARARVLEQAQGRRPGPRPRLRPGCTTCRAAGARRQAPWPWPR